MIRGYKERYGIEIINNFGSNEGVALCSGPLETPDAESRSRLFPRFGRPELDWPQRIAKITHTRLMDPDSDAEIVEPHRAGEMQIRGPVVFDGYFAAPQITARSVHRGRLVPHRRSVRDRRQLAATTSSSDA